MEIFKKDLLGRQKIPSGKPSIIAPVLDGRQDINGIKKNIEKLKKYIKDEDYQWWLTFLNNPFQHLSSPEFAEWYFDKVMPWNDNTSTQQNVGADPPTVSPLTLAMAKEREIPQVRILSINVRYVIEYDNDKTIGSALNLQGCGDD